MKIFNWIQRKLNHNVIKDGLAGNIKKSESIAIDSNTKALLEQVALVDVLDGILSIGTFGFDPLKPTNDEQTHEHVTFSDYDNSTRNEVVEEVEPLLLITFEHNFEFFNDHHDSKSGNSDCGQDIEDGIVEMDEAKNTKRTTLAELFYEDSDIAKIKHNPKESIDKKESKHNLSSFAKKCGKDSRPIKKINQLMRRVLNRKIYPDQFHGKQETHQQAIILKLLVSKPSEALSLLQIIPAETCV